MPDCVWFEAVDEAQTQPEPSAFERRRDLHQCDGQLLLAHVEMVSLERLRSASEKCLGRHPMSAPSARLELMGGFGLRHNGGYVELPWNAQRLLAFLALRRRPLPRVSVGAALWLDGTEERAASNLRTALWRVRAAAGEIIEVSGANMRLVDSVAVDLHELIESSRCLLRGDSAHFSVADVDLFGAELLPDWDEEWLQMERERIKQLRMHALEKLCDLLVSLGRFGEAIEAGLAAVEAEPLRESAQRAVIEAHLAEGNQCEAVRRFRQYEDLLNSSLGVGPSTHLRSLVAMQPSPNSPR